MRFFVAIVAGLALAVSLPALAEIQPDRTKPTWAQTKLHELRLERDWLRADNRRLRRTLMHRPDVQEALRLAAIAYGVSHATLHRKAKCESRFDPGARNTQAVGREHASGLMQFLPSTFASTPYRRESIWSMYANALAAGWMHANGRGGEWACR